MKTIFESPKLELCEFVVAARLSGSGGFTIASMHSGAPQSPCSKVPCNGTLSCSMPSLPKSSIGNVTCTG